jgi:hypothetical protein
MNFRFQISMRILKNDRIKKNKCHEPNLVSYFTSSKVSREPFPVMSVGNEDARPDRLRWRRHKK